MRTWLVVALVLLGTACSAPERERPNIVFVLVDDLNTRILPYLPELKRLMPAKGMSFDTTRAIKDTYDTDFFAQEAASWVGKAEEPFVAVWAPMSPHGPFIPAPRHRGRFANVQLRWPPSFAADPAVVLPRTHTRLEMML